MFARAWYYPAVLSFALATQPLLAETAPSSEEEGTPLQIQEIQRFSNAIGLIKKYYVKQVDDKTLFENAIRGMLAGLDPHSSYLDDEEYQELQTTTSGEFGGLGIEVTMEEGLIKIITPLVDTPAYKAGIKSGDYIIKIDQHAVQGMKLKDAVEYMRGKVNTPVNLTILRKGHNKAMHFTLNREKILIKSVKSRLLDNDYGYIRLTQFQSLTGQELQTAVNDLTKSAGGHLKGLILDLRNNPGGLLDSAIQVSDAFLDKSAQNPNAKDELIVYTEGRFPGSEFKAVANPGDILKHAPMVVLINHGSASAAEIVAGALKDNKRAIIVGTQSFGKGSVQTVLPIDDKRAIKLTTALYYTPAGISIQAKGITPDIIIEEMDIPKTSLRADDLDFSEASLSGHLSSKESSGSNQPVDKTAAATSGKPNIATKAPDNTNLMHEDYQLYSALTILRGIAVAEH